jgi:hypothetical protein
MKLSESPVDVHRSLLLGEHNEDIYGRELGRDDQLASLKAKGDSCRSASCDHRRVPTSVDKRIRRANSSSRSDPLKPSGR